MSINLHLPESVITKPCITVFGIGGAGGNAVNNMINSKLEGAEYVVANTDAQALEHSLADKKIQLGAKTTSGLGAGASPEIGRTSAEESMEEIQRYLQGSNMVFITAGMGGGTGTGAAPVIAKAAKEKGILTVGVVTKPFHFEGSHRMKTAELGILDLQKHVDTLIIIPNQNLFRIANERTTFADAFKMADDVLYAGIRGVTDLMIMPGLINLDFADVRTVMSEMGKAMMGTGEAEGENRAILAAEAAISNPLLDHSSMKGAKGVIISITGGDDLTLFEVDEAANKIRDEVDPNANIIFGSTFDQSLKGKIRVSVVATGIDSSSNVKNEDNSGNANIKPNTNNWDSNKQNNSQFEINTQEESNFSIPSMPNKYFAGNDEQISEDEFTPQRPVEPKFDAILNEQASRRENESVIAQNHEYNQRRETTNNFPSNYIKEEDKPVKKPLGIFGRMMAGASNNKTGQMDERQAHNSPTGTDKNDHFDDDPLNMPAFLRRKK